MRPTVFQRAELRDENDNIIQQGTYGKGSALSNSTNDGWIDYVMNNLEALYGIAKDEVVPVSALPASGDMNKTYLLTTTGVCYRWDGTAWVEISSSEAVGRAEAAADLAEEWATKTSGAVDGNEYSAKHYSNISKDWANKLNATVDGSEYSAKYYANSAQQSADDAQDVADDMADHLAQIDQNTGGVSANSKRIGNIEKLLQGNLYDYQTDTTSAYTKSVPSGAMPYAGLEKVGGKTVVWNQLQANTQSRTTAGVVFTFDSTNGTLTVSEETQGATRTATAYWLASSVLRWNWIEGHKYLICLHGSGGLESSNWYITDPNIYFSGDTYFWTATDSRSAYLGLRVKVENDISTPVTFKPQVFDLTLMFGSGNEPSTVEEFEAMFPADYYAYNAGTLLSAGVTSVVSKDSNNATLQTYSIPAPIQALEGYGWSAGTAYNYIDFERKVFVKNVDRVDFGSLNWVRSVTNDNARITSEALNNMKAVSSNTVVGNIICANFSTTYFENVFYGTASDNSFSITTSRNFGVKTDNYTDATTFKNAMNGVYAYYELETPVETDISAYLTDDNLINVESGGTLTFPNSNGDDYRLPVPSEETYMIDLQEALS